MRLSIGIDITEEEAQICYYDEASDKVVSVSCIKGENRFVVPLLPEEMEQEGFLSIFERLARLVQGAVGDFEIERVGIAVKEKDQQILKKLTYTFANMNITPKKVDILNYDESFAYYVINQPEDINNGDVLLLKYDGDNLHVKRIEFIRNRRPYGILMDGYKKEMPDDEEEFDKKLYRILNDEIEKGRISTIYIAGDEFGLAAIKKILGTRKVAHAYYGKNLFANGACFAVTERPSVNYEDYRILSEDRTIVDISVLIDHNGKNTKLLLSKAGTSWQAAGAKVQCLLDDITSVNFVIVSATGGITTNYSMDLGSFPKRKNKTTRVEISVIYKQEDRFEIAIKDLGFGEFFRSSGKVVKDTLLVDNFI